MKNMIFSIFIVMCLLMGCTTSLSLNQMESRMFFDYSLTTSLEELVHTADHIVIGEFGGIRRKC